MAYGTCERTTLYVVFSLLVILIFLDLLFFCPCVNNIVLKETIYKFWLRWPRCDISQKSNGRLINKLDIFSSGNQRLVLLYDIYDLLVSSLLFIPSSITLHFTRNLISLLMPAWSALLQQFLSSSPTPLSLSHSLSYPPRDC